MQVGLERRWRRTNEGRSPQSIRNDQVVWEVSVEQEQAIMFAIEHEFKDPYPHV